MTSPRSATATTTFRRELPAPENWPAIHALLRPAIAHGGDTDVIELIDDLLDARAQLWVKRSGGPDNPPLAAAVTTVSGTSLHCQLLGGRGMNDWLDELIDTVAACARPRGIKRFTMEGRSGWKRVLAQKGWRQRRIAMELEL